LVCLFTFSMFIFEISALFINIGLFIYVSNAYLQNSDFVYKHWFVYVRFQCLFTKFRLCLQTLVCLCTFSVFIYQISALFTNIDLFIYVSNVYFRNFGFVYKHWFVYLQIFGLFTNNGLFIYVFSVYLQNFRFVYKHWFVYLRFQCLFTKFRLCLQTLVCLFTFPMFIYKIPALFTNIGLFIYVFNVYLQNFRFVYKHWIVYLRFKCLFTKFRLCLQTLVCLFTFPMFIFEISALFINIGLFIYIFCVCLHPECRQTCRRYVARFLDICFLRWLKMRWKNDGRGIESRLKERKCIFTMAYRMVDFNLLT
jgi:hypothetical protein